MIRIPIRIVFYKEQDRVIAHCLEFNLLGDGETKEESLECLKEAIAVQAEAIQEGETLADGLFNPADPKLFEMFSRGKDVAATATVQLIRSQGDEMDFRNRSMAQ